jgi:hypothetical protein
MSWPPQECKDAREVLSRLEAELANLQKPPMNPMKHQMIVIIQGAIRANMELIAQNCAPPSK